MTSEEHPDGWQVPVTEGAHSPMRFAWADTAAALQAQAAKLTPADTRRWGASIELPAPSMPTLSIQVHQLQAGWCGTPYRHRASSIFVVLQGQGRSQVGSQQFDWSFGDVIAAPMFVALRHEAQAPSVIVELSDDKLMRHCGYYALEDLPENPSENAPERARSTPP